MTLVSDDPSWWPVINGNLLTSYIVVSASVGVMYDWALTFGQEVELVWRQRWSLMTVLYLSVRYGGIIYAALRILANVPTISVTDAGCYVMFVVANSMAAAVDAMLCVIMITRLYAMYQQSRKVLIFLVVIFLALTIAAIALGTIPMTDGSGEELILSGTYWCNVQLVGNSNILECIGWMLVVVWEVLAVCLAVWIAVKHFRELRRYSAAGIIEDFLAMLLKTHVVYFASCLVVSCISIGHLSSTISKNGNSLGAHVYGAFDQMFLVLQMCVLGPRLILSVREYHAKLVADSDAATGMTSIAFQERVHVSTSSSV